MSLPIVRKALAGLLLALPISAEPIELGKQFFHKDWAAACDNILSCEAVSLMPEGDGSRAPTIVITRENGLEGAIAVKISLAEPTGDRYRILVDGRQLGSGELAKGEWPISSTGADALKLARAIGRGRKIAILGGDNSKLGELVLNGSTAALLHIDAVQGRKGTRTALVSAGRRALRPKPVVQPVIVAQRIGKQDAIPDATAMVSLIESSGCIEERSSVTEDTVFSLGKHADGLRALAIISCGTGAYNMSSVPFIGRSADGKKWSFVPASFDNPAMPKLEASSAVYLVNYSWDAETQQLSSYNKARGLGDCGNAETYVWDGATFRLVQAYAMSECRGSTEWMTIWRAKVEYKV
jgi:hypothetical protein